jgi:hypothetical protein
MNPEAFHAAADLVAKRRREAVDEDQLRAVLEGAEHGLRAAAFALGMLRAKMHRGGRKAASALALEREIADEVTRDVSLAAYQDGRRDGRREAGEASPLHGKWDDPYIQKLGALEHLDECLALHRAQAVAKAEGRSTDVARLGGQLEYELMDLYLILQKRFAAFGDTVQDRAAKFRP